MSMRRFGRTLASLEGIFGFVAEFIKANGLDAAQAFEVELVLEELFTNQVKYNPEASHEVEVRLEREGPTVLVVLRDFDVEPFDLTQAPEVDVSRPLSERQTGGLGLHLVRQIAERVRYEHRDRCSTITVSLRLEP
jgi:serine/threonine-protein kinase RsbW